ncbi:MAG: hypothetical protein AAFR28_18685 [Pseudomonadota bacterium]
MNAASFSYSLFEYTPRDILNDERLDDADRRVATWVACHNRFGGRNEVPDLEFSARFCALSIEVFQRSEERLRAFGFLATQRNPASPTGECWRLRFREETYGGR